MNQIFGVVIIWALFSISCIKSADLEPCVDKECITPIGKPILNLNRWNDGINSKLSRYGCVGSVSHTEQSANPTWSVVFKCPKLTNIIGTSTNMNSRSAAIQMAVRDFVNKAFMANVIKPGKFFFPKKISINDFF